MTRGWCGAGRFAMGLRNIMALQKKTRGVVRLYQGISEIVADIWRPTVKDGLGRSKTPQSGSPDSSRQHRQVPRTLHNDMLTADDDKIRQIVGLLDDSPDHHALHAVLDPLRPRLAALRPARPLRFTRLLFTPFADLLVPARAWKPGLAS